MSYKTIFEKKGAFWAVFLGGAVLQALAFFSLIFSDVSHAVTIETIPTQVTVSICGDGNVAPGQDCDDGSENNICAYSLTITGRTCCPNCKWAAYCGDGIVQTQFGEECDDGTNTGSGFCTADCKAKAVVGPIGGTGGGSGPFVPGSSFPTGVTSVTVSGRAYPNSNVNILKDGTVIGVVSSDSKAAFTFTTHNVTPGTATFGFWAEDNKGLRSISYTVTFEVIAGTHTTVSGVFIPPTIESDKNSVAKGETITFTGETVPEVTVRTQINSEPQITKEAASDDSGKWKLELDTAPLREGLHTAKAMFQLGSEGTIQDSSFGRAISFAVGVPFTAQAGSADLNGDGKVNLIDFSILLFHWGTSNPAGDVNRDGIVNLADFSIMLFQWTG